MYKSWKKMLVERTTNTSHQWRIYTVYRKFTTEIISNNTNPWKTILFYTVSISLHWALEFCIRSCFIEMWFLFYWEYSPISAKITFFAPNYLVLTSWYEFRHPYNFHVATFSMHIIFINFVWFYVFTIIRCKAICYNYITGNLSIEAIQLFKCNNGLYTFLSTGALKISESLPFVKPLRVDWIFVLWYKGVIA